jgi:hypothetical protein
MSVVMLGRCEPLDYLFNGDYFPIEGRLLSAQVASPLGDGRSLALAVRCDEPAEASGFPERAICPGVVPVCPFFGFGPWGLESYPGRAGFGQSALLDEAIVVACFREPARDPVPTGVVRGLRWEKESLRGPFRGRECGGE